MKDKLITVLKACAILTAVALGVYYGYNTFFKSKAAMAAPQYYIVTAQKMNLQVTVQGTGTAYAAVSKDVTSNNNGTLKDLSVKAGDTVTAGQKLFTADSYEVRKAALAAENNLARQKLSLVMDQNSQRPDTNKIAMDNIAISDAQIQLDKAYKQIDNMTMTAPISGTVTAVNLSNGDNVQSNKTVITIVDMSSIRVKVSVDELHINKLKVGQSAVVRFDAIKDRNCEGIVDSISPVGTTSNNVTTYGVIVAIKDPAGIKLGMNANISINIESKENALVIPIEALIESNGEKYVLIAEKSNAASEEGSQTAAGQYEQKQSAKQKNGTDSIKAKNSGQGKLIAVKTGLADENFIEILEGLTEGEKIIVELPDTTASNDKNNQKKVKDLVNGNTAAKQPKTSTKK